MAKGYQGRHAVGAHRRPVAEASTSRANQLPGILRRPLVSAAAILAAAGVCAAASSEAVRPPPEVRLSASPLAGSRAPGQSHNQDATNASATAVGISGVQRASVRSHREQAAKKAAKDAARKAAAVRAVQAKVKEARALARARVLATEQVARAKARRDLRDAAKAAKSARSARSAQSARSDPKAAARLLVADRGWSGEQFGCLDKLWTKESGWRWNADNPGSDAYGIPQALPGSKMASAGSDWASNPVTQVTWGLQYISARYGNPCAAWAHSRSVNWY